MGKGTHAGILHRIEIFLKLPPNSLTSHVWRRSAATELANSGISLLGLKRAGRWKNLASAEEYLEHSIPVQQDRVNRLFHNTGNTQHINVVGDDIEIQVRTTNYSTYHSLTPHQLTRHHLLLSSHTDPRLTSL